MCIQINPIKNIGGPPQSGTHDEVLLYFRQIFIVQSTYLIVFTKCRAYVIQTDKLSRVHQEQAHN